MSSEVTLARHPGARSDAVKAITARLERRPGLLEITYVLEGNLAELRLPTPGPARRGENLWQHTCFELFIAPCMPAYREFNFSPSREWAAYAFDRYRQEMPAAALDEPSVSVRRSASALELDATIPLRHQARLSIALSAVVEGKQGELSHWALKHPPGKPDFHHPDSFALELDEIRD